MPLAWAGAPAGARKGRGRGYLEQDPPPGVWKLRGELEMTPLLPP